MEVFSVIVPNDLPNLLSLDPRLLHALLGSLRPEPPLMSLNHLMSNRYKVYLIFIRDYSVIMQIFWYTAASC